MHDRKIQSIVDPANKLGAVFICANNHHSAISILFI